MLDHVVIGASSLVKRGVEDGRSNASSWAWPVFTLEFLLFLPVLVFLTYTLGTLYPALAIVEDDHAPPTYQPLPLDTDNAEEGGQARAPVNEFPVTASLRRVHALVKSIDGWRSLLRGLLPLLVTDFATSFLRLVFAVPLGPIYLAPLASIPAHLALVQLHTVWLHVVITPPNPTPFWKRLTPFGKTFRATVRPIILYALAKEIARGVPVLAFLMVFGKDEAGTNPFVALLFAPLFFVLWFFVELPAQIALVRIQASLLPPDEDSIVPFDRSFGGRVNPLLMVGNEGAEGEKTVATLRDIWETISKAAMWRVAKLVIKATGLLLGAWMLFLVVIGVTGAAAGVDLKLGDGQSRDWW